MEHWVSSWGFLPLNFIGKPFTVSNETQRIYVRNNVRGAVVRLLFSNRSGKTPMVISRVTIAHADEDRRTYGHTEVTFDGTEGVTLQPGQERYSDAISFKTKADSWLAISTYTKERQTWNCSCTTNNRTYTIAEDCEGGDFCDCELLEEQGVLHNPKIPGDIRDMKMYGFCQLDVQTEDEVRTIVCFGDSITHIGHWSGWLAKRLYAAYPGQVSLINRGIGGNRLLGGMENPDHPKNLQGAAGIRRFRQDVFGQTKGADNPVHLVILLEGVNDLNHWRDASEREVPVTCGRLQEAVRYCIRTSHAEGAKIVTATVLPTYDYAHAWRERTEGMRQAFNYWIRFGNEADGMLDFDRSVRDEANPIAMLPLYDIGDHLHPSFEGGKKIAEDIDLEKIRKLAGGSDE